MKFTKAYRVTHLLALIAMLAACSSVSEKTEEPKPDNKIIIEDSLNAINIEHLLTQPNRYLVQNKIIPAETRKEFNLALKAKFAGKLDKAEVALTRLTVDEPSLSGPWVQLGDIAKERAQRTSEIELKKQLLEKAAVQYHRALSINPNNYYGHNRLAMLYREQGQFELALTHYQKAIDSWPAFATAYKNRGILFDLYLGDKAKALNDYQVYQALNNAKASTENKAHEDPIFVKQQRQIKGWIADLTRQLQQQSDQNTKQQTEVVNNAL